MWEMTAIIWTIKFILLFIIGFMIGSSISSFIRYLNHTHGTGPVPKPQVRMLIFGLLFLVTFIVASSWENAYRSVNAINNKMPRNDTRIITPERQVTEPSLEEKSKQMLDNSHQSNQDRKTLFENSQ